MQVSINGRPYGVKHFNYGRKPPKNKHPGTSEGGSQN